MNICEAYAKKLSISEKVYAKEHGGRELSESKKIAIARVLANTSEYLNEAFENSVGTQLGNMKTFKKFCLDLTTVALPNLIANDLVIVYPMKSRTGFIQYLQFTAGTNKGGVTQGEVWNDPFRLGKMTPERESYTSAAVTESLTAGTGNILAWSPVVKGTFTHVDETTGAVVVDGDVKLVHASGDPTYGWVKAGKDADGKIYTTSACTTEYTAVAGDKAAYIYDNVVIPQNDLPILNAQMEGIALSAKARRIAVYYSQMAAFQAKTEMGIDLGEVLATQACAELSYEIDSEVVRVLDEAAGVSKVTFDRTLPIGVSKRDHYAGFAEVIEVASRYIYDATQKHAANYLVCASSIKPILSLMEGWKAASNSKINGPYFAGEINGVKVYVSPALAVDRFFVGYNGDDMVTSAAVYAPYMAIVPTQLLGFADGSMSQGFSTLYDLQILNKGLLCAGNVIGNSFNVVAGTNDAPVFSKTAA